MSSASSQGRGTSRSGNIFMPYPPLPKTQSSGGPTAEADYCAGASIIRPAYNMKGLLNGLKSESIHCDANAECDTPTRPLRVPSSLQDVSVGSSPRATTGTAAAADETAALTETIMTLKLEMAELRTSLDATAHRERKLSKTNADLQDRCTKLTTERDGYKSKLRKAIDALSKGRARIKDTERTNAELRVRLEAAEAERDGAKRERRSALDKLLASPASFDEGYASIVDEGDGSASARRAVSKGAASVASRSIRSTRTSSTGSLDHSRSQRYDFTAELKACDGGSNPPLPVWSKNRFHRGRNPTMSRNEPSLQQHQHQHPSDSLSDDEGYLRGEYSSSTLDQHSSTSMCSLAEENVGATTTLELNDTSSASSRGRYTSRRCRSMGDDNAEWEVTRPSLASGPRSWLRQSLGSVFQPNDGDGGDNSARQESWNERTFRVPGVLGTLTAAAADDQNDRRPSLASLASMESEQVAIEEAFDAYVDAMRRTGRDDSPGAKVSKKGSTGVAPPSVALTAPTASPTAASIASLRSSGSSGDSGSNNAGSDMACATHHDSISIEDLSWPSEDMRQALKEKRSRSSSIKNDKRPVPVDVTAGENDVDDDDDDNSIQPTSEVLGNSKNSSSSHDTAKDVDLFFDMFHSNDDDSLGSEDAHYREVPTKSDISKDGTTTSKGDANSASSFYSNEGGKIPLRRVPRRNSCDAQAA